jgi:hypothetical protein
MMRTHPGAVFAARAPVAVLVRHWVIGHKLVPAVAVAPVSEDAPWSRRSRRTPSSWLTFRLPARSPILPSLR